MSIKNYNDTIGNRICDLPACSAVAAVIHIQSLRSQVCVYVHMFFTIQRERERDDDREK